MSPRCQDQHVPVAHGEHFARAGRQAVASMLLSGACDMNSTAPLASTGLEKPLHCETVPHSPSRIHDPFFGSRTKPPDAKKTRDLHRIAAVD